MSSQWQEKCQRASKEVSLLGMRMPMRITTQSSCIDCSARKEKVYLVVGGTYLVRIIHPFSSMIVLVCTGYPVMNEPLR